MIALAQTLPYYKRQDVQKMIFDSCQEREVGIRYGDSFGKRPDVVRNHGDIWEAVKQGATSFHISEERWNDPMELSPGMRKEELDELRKGWDFIIDVDCQYWEYSKLITHLMLKILEEKGISCATVKFSGNKGFHIAVPFEAFPKGISELKEVSSFFPDGTRILLEYLIFEVERRFMNLTKEDILQKTGKDISEFKTTECDKCHKKYAPNSLSAGFEFICSVCDLHVRASKGETYKKCVKCQRLMIRIDVAPSCMNCGGKKFSEIFDLSAVMSLDSVLISSRHLFRAPYSMHEKSGLVSLPIKKENVLSFSKEQASPENLPANLEGFMERTANPAEATRLFDGAFQHWKKKEVKESVKIQREFSSIENAIPEDFFPPCVKNAFAGLKDGKKRAVFFLINFLSVLGWSYDDIEKRLDKWNSSNSPPLRKGFIQSQIRHHKAFKKKILPPNCDNLPYYKDIGICTPDSLCSTIKNPANYSIKKARQIQKPAIKPKKAEKKPKVPNEKEIPKAN